MTWFTMIITLGVAVSAASLILSLTPLVVDSYKDTRPSQQAEEEAAVRQLAQEYDLPWYEESLW